MSQSEVSQLGISTKLVSYNHLMTLSKRRTNFVQKKSKCFAKNMYPRRRKHQTL